MTKREGCVWMSKGLSHRACMVALFVSVAFVLTTEGSLSSAETCFAHSSIFLKYQKRKEKGTRCDLYLEMYHTHTLCCICLAFEWPVQSHRRAVSGGKLQPIKHADL